MEEILLQTMSWWLALFLMGMLALAFGIRIFSAFRDKGYLFAKVLGLAILSYLVFLLASFRLMPFRFLTLLLAAAACLLAECLWLLFSKAAAGQMGAVVRDRSFWKHAVLEEAVFALALFFWAYLRSRTPALDHTEMFMDHGFVKSLLNTDYLPALDMWYAGGTINYYYYGQYLTASLCKLTGNNSGVGYNLMMATLFALTLLLSFSVVYQLLSRKKEIKAGWAAVGGGIAALMVSVAGNAHAFLYAIVFPWLSRLGIMDYTYRHDLDRYWYPDATRYIHCYEGSKDATITEFPLYSFVLSDLHAHVVDIIFVLTFLALWIALTDRWEAEHRSESIKGIRDCFRLQPMILLLGFVLGIMGMTNYWDFAIYMVVSAFFAVYGAVMKYQSWREPRLYLTAGWQLLCLFLIRMLVMLPFSLNFDKINVGLAFVYTSSPIGEYLVLWAIPVIWAACLFLYCYRRRDIVEGSDIVAAILALCGLGLIVAPEVIYIKDIYVSAPRSNTMFKFTYEAFILFGLIAGYTFVCLMNRREQSWRGRIACGVLMAALLFPPLCYPYYAVHEVYFTGTDSRTLDGLAYIEQEDAGEYAAIQWIDENTSVDAVLLEANGISYTKDNRISMATGRQTVQGWWTHQMLWRNLSSEELDVRINDIREIYEGTDALKAEQLLEQYNVDYICITDREWEKFPALQLEKLQGMSEHIYDFGGTLVLQTKQNQNSMQAEK